MRSNRYCCVGAGVATLFGSAAAAASGGGTPDRPLTLNLSAATASWRAIEDRAAVSHIIYGDSISALGGQYSWWLRDFLEQEYGNSGSGYLAFDNQFSHNQDPDRQPNRHVGLEITLINSQWVESPGPPDQGPQGLSRRTPDGEYRRIGSIGGLELSFYGPQATLHYIQETGAGVIRIDVNGLKYFVDAHIDDPTPRLASFTFATGQADPEVLVTAQITLEGATEQDPQWTQLNGLQTVTGQGGSAFYRLTQAWGPALFLDLDQAFFQDALSAMEVELVIVMLDPGLGDGPNYGANMNEFVHRVEAALPNAGIILASHHNYDDSVADDVEALLEIATERGHGLINLFELHPGGGDELAKLGFLEDLVHMTEVGAIWFADYYFRLLRGDLVPQAYIVETGVALLESFGRLVQPDDYPFEVQSAEVLRHVEATLELSFQTDAADFTAFDLALEGHATQAGVSRRIDLWDVALGDWVVAVPDHASSTEDQFATYFNFDAAKYADADGQIKVQFLWSNDAADPFVASLDYVGIVNLDDAACPADLDHDDSVGPADLLTLLGAWGPNQGHPADLNGDGLVGTADLLLLLGDWGVCE